MEDLGNNNWTIIHLLKNIYEINANLTVMILNKRSICKSKFHATIFF